MVSQTQRVSENKALRACMLLPIYYLMVISCNTLGVATSSESLQCCRSVHFFQWNESEHVVLPIIIIWHSVHWISGALNEHY